MKCLVPLKIEIKKLDINESFFVGKAEFEGDEYTINVQGEWQEKLLKLPFRISTQEHVRVRLTGPGGFVVEDALKFRGVSEWIEIDSQDMLHYVADHQDQFDSLEICFSDNLE